MPTRSVLASFLRDWQSLTPQQQRQFLAALKQFITDLREPQPTFHPRLRVKRMQGHPSTWEMSWAPDGRATFEYGDEVQPGQAHIIWRRVGTHSIFKRP
jgi:mRNA-degrading endonuclease YafQ of YafQ-DinJ toxin-antitoxin module